MKISAKILLAIALSTLFASAASAKTTTINDITLDVPENYSSSSSKHGLLVKTPDSSVDVWVEVVKMVDVGDLKKEHDAYWEKNKVVLNGEGDGSETKVGDVNVAKVDYTKATWKGDPTVLRYTFIGPLGSEQKLVLITYWASPAGDRSFGPDLQAMIKTMTVKTQQ